MGLLQYGFTKEFSKRDQRFVDQLEGKIFGDIYNKLTYKKANDNNVLIAPIILAQYIDYKLKKIGNSNDNAEENL